MEQRKYRRLSGEGWMRPEKDGALPVPLYAYCARLLALLLSFSSRGSMDTASSVFLTFVPSLSGQVNQRIPYVCPKPVWTHIH